MQLRALRSAHGAKRQRQTVLSVTGAKNRRDTGMKDHAFEHPEKFPRSQQTKLCKLPHWRRFSDYAVAEYYTAVLE